MQQINYYRLAGHLMTCEGFMSAKEAQPVDKKNRYIINMLQFNRLIDK